MLTDYRAEAGLICHMSGGECALGGHEVRVLKPEEVFKTHIGDRIGEIIWAKRYS